LTYNRSAIKPVKSDIYLSTSLPQFLLVSFSVTSSYSMITNYRNSAIIIYYVSVNLKVGTKNKQEKTS